MNEYSFSPQTWATQTPSSTQSLYQRHNSHPGQYYLPTEVVSAIPYNQRQFVSMAPTSLASESRPVYSNSTIEDAQYYDRRQNLGPPSGHNAILQEPSSNPYNTSLSGSERRSTMPVAYSSQQNQASLQFQPESGQFTLPSQYTVQHTPQTLYSQNSQPRTFANHRGVSLGENQRAYVKYPS